MADFSSTQEALRSMRARTLVMPAEKDLYPPQDERWAVSPLATAQLRVIPGVWGHFAGGGANPVDTRFIDAAHGSCWSRNRPVERRVGDGVGGPRRRHCGPGRHHRSVGIVGKKKVEPGIGVRIGSQPGRQSWRSISR